MFGNPALHVSPVSETAMAWSRIRLFAKRTARGNGGRGPRMDVLPGAGAGDQLPTRARFGPVRASS